MRPPLGLLAVLLLVAAPARGQHREMRSEQPFFPCWMAAPDVTDAHPAHRTAPVPRAFVRGSGQAAATFEVTYEGFSAQAQAAFQAAVDVWAEHVTSSVPIRIRARWTDLGGNLLGSAGPYLITGFQGAPAAGTWYPYALADALAGRDLDANRPDIEASFNSSYAHWYLGTDGNGPSSQVELFTVVLHELGHGLGFIGSATVENGQGDLGLSSSSGSEYPFIFDRFAEDAQGRKLLDRSVYPQPSAALANALTSAVFFGGGTVEAAYGQHAPLYAPATWNEGSSYSHFDEATFPPDSADGLMTPRIAPGERKDNPGPLLCASLKDLGWTLAPACADLIPDSPPPPPPPPVAVYSLVPATCLSPDSACGELDTIVTDGSAAFNLVVADGQSVDAFLFDTRGRRVAVIPVGAVEAGETTRITIAAGNLAAGMYFLRVIGEEFAATRRVVRLR